MTTDVAEPVRVHVDGIAGDVDQLEFLHELQSLVWRLHATPNLREVSAIAANDGRQLLDADRISIAVTQGRLTEIVSVSGQDRINPRANQIRLLAALAAQVMATNELFLFAGSGEDMPPQLTRLVGDYVLESGSRQIMIVPLLPPEQEPPRQVGVRAVERRPTAIGALILEQFGDAGLQPNARERAILVAEHVAVAVANSLAWQQVLLLPARRFVGRQLAWFRGRSMAKLFSIVFTFATAVGAMIAVPGDYRIEGRGRLMPTVRGEAFAPRNGEVVELLVTNGEHVSIGQALLKLRDADLEAELLASRNRLQEKRQLQQTLKAEFDEASRSGARPEWIRLRGKLSQVKSDIEGETEQVRLLEEQAGGLLVRAPISGTVTTFQPRQLLLNRPVQRGEALLEVMDETGPWRLELSVPEYRMGHLLAAQQKTSNALSVEFVLASLPESHYQARLEQVATRSAITARDGSIVEVYAALHDAELPQKRIGAEVQAKIQCGRSSLAYVLFGDVVEFVQRQFWF